MSTLTAEDLLAGSETTFTIDVPTEVLRPGESPADDRKPDEASVVIRPLLLADLQRIAKAAPDSNELSSVLMVQMALVDPVLSIDQVAKMHAGLVEFLLGEVNRVSGLGLGADELEAAVQAPMARACFVLSREFGWTPDECAQLTIGQVLLYLEMLGRNEGSWGAVEA